MEALQDRTPCQAASQRFVSIEVTAKRGRFAATQDSDSEPENVSVARTSTPIKIHTATNSKTTPVNSRNRKLLLNRHKLL